MTQPKQGAPLSSLERANTRFARLARQRDEGVVAMAAYVTERSERAEKTARLRKLRLDKEAADKAKEAPPKAKATKRPAASKTKAS